MEDSIERGEKIIPAEIRSFRENENTENNTERQVKASATIDSEILLTETFEKEQRIVVLTKKKNQQKVVLIVGCILSILTIVALAGLWAWSVSNVTSDITK